MRDQSGAAWQVLTSLRIPPVLLSYRGKKTHSSTEIQGVSKRMTRFQIIISNNENVLQLQNKLQTIK